MDGERFRISHSKVVAFERCRKQYWFRYLSGQPKPPDPVNPEGLIGLGVHRAMKALCLTGDAEDGASELDSYLRMPSHEVAGPGTEANRVAVELFRRGVEAHVSIVSQDRWAELDTWVPHAGIVILARIDRADRVGPLHWQVIDWKTGRYDIDEITDGQLDIGHLAVRTIHQLRRDVTVTAVAWNLRTGQQRVRALDRRDAAATVHRLRRTAERILATADFPATPGPACRFCEWRDRCPEAAYVEAGRFEWLEEEGDGVLPEEGDPAVTAE